MYRANVCAILFNENEEILGCLRMPSRRNPGRGLHYQFIQGGVERDDRNIVLAALREINEEVGLLPSDVEFVQEILPPSGDPKEFRYRLAPESNLRVRHGYEGQEQRMLLFFAPASVIHRVVLVPPPSSGKGAPKQEFSKVEWMTFQTLKCKGHPEKLKLFEKLSHLAPPIMKAYLAKRKELMRSSLPSSREEEIFFSSSSSPTSSLLLLSSSTSPLSQDRGQARYSSSSCPTTTFHQKDEREVKREVKDEEEAKEQGNDWTSKSHLEEGREHVKHDATLSEKNLLNRKNSIGTSHI